MPETIKLPNKIVRISLSYRVPVNAFDNEDAVALAFQAIKENNITPYDTHISINDNV